MKKILVSLIFLFLSIPIFADTIVVTCPLTQKTWTFSGVDYSPFDYKVDLNWYRIDTNGMLVVNYNKKTYRFSNRYLWYSYPDK